MNKTKNTDKLRPLALKKETIVTLATDQLKLVAGGNTSGSKIESQCDTLCYTND